MPRLSKKAKQEWKFFIAPNTGRRTYNKLCRKCHSDCKQSYRVIIVYCRKFKAKRSVITKDDKYTYKEFQAHISERIADFGTKSIQKRR